LIFIHKNDKFVFEPPFGGVTGIARTFSIVRSKARGRFPICGIWTLFASSYGWDVI